MAMRLTTGRPTTFIAKPYMANRVTDLVCAFLEDYYSAIFTLERESNENGYITISAEGLAYFVKTVFCAVFGRSVIKIVFSSSGNQYEMRFTFNKPTELSDETIAELRSLAHASGMTLLAGKLGAETILQLKATKRPTKYLTVYAMTDEEITNAFRRVFIIQQD